MLQGSLILLFGLAATLQSAAADETPDDWARDLNNERFDSEAYHGQPWEEYRKAGFFPREPPRRVVLDGDIQSEILPTPTSGDDASTRTLAVHLMPRDPTYTFTCNPGANCYTYACS